MPNLKLTHSDALALFSKEGIENIKALVIRRELSIHAVEELHGNGLLHIVASGSHEEEVFVNFLNFFLEQGGNINLLNKGAFTAFDLCPLFYKNEVHYKKKAIQTKGGISGRFLSGSSRKRTAEAILPGTENFPPYKVGFFGSIGSPAPIDSFSFEDRELHSVRDHLAFPKINSDGFGLIDVCPILKSGQLAISQLFDDEESISSAFLIKADWIITARHSVNFSALADLRAVFDNADSSAGIPISGIIESGEDNGLDYIILKLAQPVPYTPLKLTNDNASTSLLFMGYNSDSVLCFSASPNSNPGQLSIAGYQQTGSTLSGSPYFDLSGRVCGIHSHASTTEKTGIYIQHILETQQNSVLALLIAAKDVSHIETQTDAENFREFTCAIAELGEFDERKPLSISVNMNAGKPYFVSEGGPGNQSARTVQNKIKRRILQLKPAERTAIQQKFIGRIDYDLKNNQIDIAHCIAISPITKALVAKMNTPISLAEEITELKAAIDFADAIASSDDDTAPKKPARIKQKLPNLIREIRTAQKKIGGITKSEAETLAKKAEEVLKVLNQRSKNLMPGHHEVNNAIQDCRDPHLIKTSSGYQETATSKKLAETAQVFLGKHYVPEKKFGDKAMSSSVDSLNDKSQAFYKP